MVTISISNQIFDMLSQTSRRPLTGFGMQFFGQAWRSTTSAPTLSESSDSFMRRPRVQSSSTVARETGSEHQLESDRGVYSLLVSWYFEPSQPQRITSGLKQTSICLPFTLHTSHQTTDSLKTTKSVLTQVYLKQNIHKRQTQNFRRISPDSGTVSIKNTKRTTFKVQDYLFLWGIKYTAEKAHTYS